MINRDKNKFKERVDLLLDGIKKDYANWGNDIDTLDEPQKSIRLKMIDEFNNGLRLSHGRKYIKVIQNGSVWGFIAVTDGVLKGIPYKFGDVFKAAGWRAPAKHVRGSIYLDRTDWFHWTGPRYL
jgi:hypothetical protein|tara:strand:+ start:1339 stop:1713 length:375 start_codon:yes stop_codon:yes gene_type:complete